MSLIGLFQKMCFICGHHLFDFGSVVKFFWYICFTHYNFVLLATVSFLWSFIYSSCKKCLLRFLQIWLLAISIRVFLVVFSRDMTSELLSLATFNILSLQGVLSIFTMICPGGFLFCFCIFYVLDAF